MASAGSVTSASSPTPIAPHGSPPFANYWLCRLPPSTIAHATIANAMPRSPGAVSMSARAAAVGWLRPLPWPGSLGRHHRPGATVHDPADSSSPALLTIRRSRRCQCQQLADTMSPRTMHPRCHTPATNIAATAVPLSPDQRGCLPQWVPRNQLPAYRYRALQSRGRDQTPIDHATHRGFVQSGLNDVPHPSRTIVCVAGPR